jgi:hypothetical protein
VAGQLQGGGGLSGSPPRIVPARQRARDAADGGVHRRRASGFDGDGDVSALLDKKQSTALASGLAEKRDEAEKKLGETAGIDPRLLPSTLAPARFLGRCCPGKAMVLSVELREERGRSEGQMGSSGRFQRGVWGFIVRAWSRYMVHLEGEDWAMQAVSLGRRSGLSPTVRLWCRGACCNGRGDTIFSSSAREPARDTAS